MAVSLPNLAPSSRHSLFSSEKETILIKNGTKLKKRRKKNGKNVKINLNNINLHIKKPNLAKKLKQV